MLLTYFNWFWGLNFDLEVQFSENNWRIAREFIAQISFIGFFPLL